MTNRFRRPPAKRLTKRQQRLERGRDIKPTRERTMSDLGHRPPSSRHALGRLDGGLMGWHGGSRITDRPERRRRNAASWARFLRDARNAHLDASGRAKRHLYATKIDTPTNEETS